MASVRSIFALSLLLVVTVAAAETARVEGKVWSFGPLGSVDGFYVTSPELPDWSYTVDKDGAFAVDAPVGSNVTFIGEKSGWSTTKSATVTVPPGGLIGRQNAVTIQTPDGPTFDIFAWATGAHPKNGFCHVVVTVTAFEKTLGDDPQGEPNATVSIDPPAPAGNKPFYFGIWDGITNPFARNLTSTSKDGGVIWFNLPIPPAGTPYVVRANKPGKVFSTSTLWCTPEIACSTCLLNASPPQGPRVQNGP